MAIRFCLALLGVLTVGLQANAATVIVSPSNLNGWATHTTDSSGVFGTASPGVAADFATPPSPPPLGSSSAHLTTGINNGDESAQLRTTNFAGVRIADITALSYSTYATAWNDQQVPYLTIWLDLDGNGTRDDRLWFEPDYSNPPQPAAALNTWQTWDALNGKWYSDNIGGPGSNSITLATYLSTVVGTPTIINAAPGVGGFRIASGFASDTDDFEAFVDNLTFATAAGSTTYDFESADVAVPEPASLAIWGLGSLALLIGRLQRRRLARG